MALASAAALDAPHLLVVLHRTRSVLGTVVKSFKTTSGIGLGFCLALSRSPLAGPARRDGGPYSQTWGLANVVQPDLSATGFGVRIVCEALGSAAMSLPHQLECNLA